MGEDRLQNYAKVIDQKMRHITGNTCEDTNLYIGFINVEEADKNTKMNTDDLVPFDRNKFRGRVSQASAAASTRPSSSASTSSEMSSGGISLGGEKEKDDSNLLNMST